MDLDITMESESASDHTLWVLQAFQVVVGCCLEGDHALRREGRGREGRGLRAELGVSSVMIRDPTCQRRENATIPGFRANDLMTKGLLWNWPTSHFEICRISGPEHVPPVSCGLHMVALRFLKYWSAFRSCQRTVNASQLDSGYSTVCVFSFHSGPPKTILSLREFRALLPVFHSKHLGSNRRLSHQHL